MIPIPSIALAWWKPAALGVALLVAAGYGAFKMHERDQKKYDALHREFAEFRGGVAALGEAAIRQRAITEAANIRNKERADEENRKRTAAVAAAIRGLRNERDDARRRFLSQAPAGSVCPDGQVCFERADFERAYGELVDEIRALADEGTAVTIDLDTAKVWARDVR